MRLCENYVPLERRVPTPNDIFIKTVQDFHKKKKPGFDLLFIYKFLFTQSSLFD